MPAMNICLILMFTLVATPTLRFCQLNNSSAVVLKFIQSSWGKGYHLYCDRYYTSPQLLHPLSFLESKFWPTKQSSLHGMEKYDLFLALRRLKIIRRHAKVLYDLQWGIV